jgi:hypothetical protein
MQSGYSLGVCADDMLAREMRPQMKMMMGCGYLTKWLLMLPSECCRGVVPKLRRSDACNYPNIGSSSADSNSSSSSVSSY